MEFDLTPFFTTKAQATDFTVRLSALVEAVYHTDFSIENYAMEQLGITKSEHLLKLMRDNGVALNAPSAVKAFLEKLITTTKTLPVLSMTIAFEPNEGTLRTLTDWFLMNLKKQFLLELVIQPEIIGGTVIQYNGSFFDYSGKAIFDRIIKERFATPEVIDTKEKNPPVEKKKHSLEYFHMGR